MIGRDKLTSLEIEMCLKIADELNRLKKWLNSVSKILLENLEYRKVR